VTRRPELADAELEDLLGAYALNACEPDEAAAVEALLARRPELAGEVDRLCNAAVWIGATEALAPPSSLRGATLAAAHARRTGALDPCVELYLAVSDGLGRVIETLPDDALDLPTAAGITARELVVHAAAQESLVAQGIGRSPVPDLVDVDIDARTAALVERQRDRPLEESVAIWRASVEANRAWSSDPANVEATIPWLGVDLPRRDVLVIRAFETWIHTDDLRQAAGRPAVVPEARHIARMADLSGRTLGLGLALTGRGHPGRTARLRLTGAGGGEWVVAMDGGTAEPAADVDVTLTADVVEWCLLAAQRLEPSELAVQVDGDAALADDLVAAASAFATL
jgi:uncharacterized protein (TIGR03083 family)